jgi:hypothetical protein
LWERSVLLFRLGLIVNFVEEHDEPLAAIVRCVPPAGTATAITRTLPVSKTAFCLIALGFTSISIVFVNGGKAGTDGRFRCRNQLLVFWKQFDQV